MQRRSMISRVLFSGLLGLAAGPAHTQDCTVPSGFGHLTQQKADAVWSGATGESCALTTRMHTQTTPDAMAAGFSTHPLAIGTQQVRFRFDLDASALTLTAFNRNVQVVSVGGTTTVATGSTLLRVFLVGNPSMPTLRLVYSDPAQPTGYGQAEIALPDSAPQLGFDLQLGSTGYISYWVDADFSTAPTGRIPANGYVDFSTRGPASGIAFGLFNASSAFRTNNAGQDLVLRNIYVTDYILRSRFE